MVVLLDVHLCRQNSHAFVLSCVLIWFMQYCSFFIDHILYLYTVCFFLLIRIVLFLPLLIFRSLYLLFCWIYKCLKSWKVYLYFLYTVLNLLVILYNFWGNGEYSFLLQVPYIVYLYVHCFDLDRIENQKVYVLCTVYSIPKAWEVCLLLNVWNVFLHLLILFFSPFF